MGLRPHVDPHGVGIEVEASSPGVTCTAWLVFEAIDGSPVAGFRPQPPPELADLADLGDRRRLWRAE
ncbi:MAG: hypothetical protein IT377_21015 [Polyangiaceae bacterium]|nr:hypothetical protein [Polyangiaceae bacterium]